ncbi:MAG: response regulator transcription factor [Chitinophagales bacterium]|nr:response regulator transcription factor [Chitinophagales bacterium]
MDINVTIFEDNDSLREGLFQLINGSIGYKCVGAYPDCDHIIRRIENHFPDVVLMDIELPGISGIEAVKILKEKYPVLKILMQTIFEEDNNIFNSICAGASGYILKNTPPARILESIREIYEGGSPMTPSIANKVLQMVQSRSPVFDSKSFQLTDREKEVLTCLVKGMSYKLIADACFISVDTVRGHIKNIYEKLQVHSKSEAVAKAIRGKIV